jgi:hypothetical protein
MCFLIKKIKYTGIDMVWPNPFYKFKDNSNDLEKYYLTQK